MKSLLPFLHGLSEQMNDLPVEAPVFFLGPRQKLSMDIHRDAKQKAHKFGHVGSVIHSPSRYRSDIIMISLLRVNDVVLRLDINGCEVLIDEEDLEIVAPYRWEVKASRSGKGSIYVYARDFLRPDGRHRVAMHRLLLNPPTSSVVDHINRNGLDNRRQNLRIATRTQNQANRRLPSVNTSGYRGIYFSKRKNRWIARVSIGHKHNYLGSFHSPAEAAMAYDVAARHLYGEFAALNFPDGSSLL